MAVENTTPNRGYQLPHPTNDLADDVARLIAALTGIDVDIAGMLVSIASKADAEHDHVIANITGLAAALAARQELSAKGAANGYAGLGADGKVPAEQLPSALFGALSYQGVWNANTNSPTIPAAIAGNKGHYYKVSVAGATTVSGVNDWQVGDWIVSNGAGWDKIDNTDQVSSVAGLQGAISAAALMTALGLPDALAGKLPLDGSAAMTGPLVLPASTTTAPSLHIEPGISPTAPVDGDVWVDGGGNGVLQLRRNGVTVGLWDSTSLSLIPKADAEAGISDAVRLWSAERVAQAIAALTPKWTELAPVATTSGTAFDWTSIPAGVTDIEIWLDEVSSSGNLTPILQLGTGGSPTTSGYKSFGANMSNGALTTLNTPGIKISQAVGAADTISHCVRLHRTAGNRWLSFGSGLYVNGSGEGIQNFSSGLVTLAGTLDIVRLLTSTGAFDAGSVQLRYR